MFPIPSGAFGSADPDFHRGFHHRLFLHPPASGDPVALLSGERVMSPERMPRSPTNWASTDPSSCSTWIILGRLQGDFGTSIVTKKPVIDQFMELFPATVELSLCAIIFAVVVGIPRWCRRGSQARVHLRPDHHGHRAHRLLDAIFWWGLLLIIVVSGILQWTPVSGRISVDVFFPSVTGFMLIDRCCPARKGRSSRPSITSSCRRSFSAPCPLAVIGAPEPALQMLEVVPRTIVRTARAKGLSTFRVVGIHALRNAMIPVVTTIGLQVG